jgi:hypothetical protein
LGSGPGSEAEAFGEIIRAQVAEFGWSAVAVDATPPFTYTVGLWRLAEHPELIITGLPDEVAKWALDRAVQAIRDGHPIAPGTLVDGLLGDYAAAAREVDLGRLHELAFAADLYRGVIYRAVQLVWPDRQGNFPWDRAASEHYRQGQPLLFTPARSRRLFGR